MNCQEILKNANENALIITAEFEPVADQRRFQPAGFPEIGPVLYDDPKHPGQKICIVDSAASMANHLEAVSLADGGGIELHPDLAGLPYVLCVTDDEEGGNPRRPVCSTFTEGHRLASDYFLDAKFGESAADNFRQVLRRGFNIREITKDKKYYVYPDNWWSIYQTIFNYDPNSLVHGVLFAREQIKIARLLTPILEASGAKRVGRSGVKFDRLGKTTSGQPIFAVEDETANCIRGTFVIDLGLLRSYGRNDKGLNEAQKQLLLTLAIWKIAKLTRQAYRFRSGCFLKCSSTQTTFGQDTAKNLPDHDVRQAIADCKFDQTVKQPVNVHYPSSDLFKGPSETQPQAGASDSDAEAEESEG